VSIIGLYINGLVIIFGCFRFRDRNRRIVFRIIGVEKLPPIPLMPFWPSFKREDIAWD